MTQDTVDAYVWGIFTIGIVLALYVITRYQNSFVGENSATVFCFLVAIWPVLLAWVVCDTILRGVHHLLRDEPNNYYYKDDE